MIKHFITILLAFASFCAVAQKNDYVWLGGYDSDVYIDSALTGWRFGQSKLDFNYQPVKVNYDSLKMNINRTNLAYSTDDGDLLFYTNGVYVANALDEKIAGSDTMNKSWVSLVYDPWILTHGYTLFQALISLPVIGESNKYLLFYSHGDQLPDSMGYPYIAQLQAAQIDMSANLGHGEMTFKDSTIIADTLGNEITAARHANGRDWWIIVQERHTSCFKTIIYDTVGLQVMPYSDCGEGIPTYGEIASMAFSPDGSKLAHFSTLFGIKLFDFDRCTGRLENPRHIPSSFGADSFWIGCGVSFSPNGRFVYMSASEVIIQYDTWETDIIGSADTIGKYDGFRLPNASMFNTSQLGPDGKIYIACGNSEAVFHVINNPDEKGAACNFAQHSLRLPTLVSAVPHFPNYRLGALPGSPCDTITGIKDIAEKEKLLKIFPNPAADIATIDYGYTDWSKGEATMEISNYLGQVVHSQTLPMYSGFQKLEVANYPSGAYTVYIKRKGLVVATGKLVKE